MTRMILFAVLIFSLWACAVDMATRRDPLDPAEHLRLGGIYESKGAFDLALAEYIKAVREDETNPDAWFAAGNMELRLKMFGQAERDYAKALEINPSNAVYHNNLGWLYMELGKFDRAEAEAATARRVDPEHEYIYLDTLGVIAMRRKDYTEAGRYLEAAAQGASVGNSGGKKEIYSHLLELYNLTGDRDKAAAIEKMLGEENE